MNRNRIFSFASEDYDESEDNEGDLSPDLYQRDKRSKTLSRVLIANKRGERQKSRLRALSIGNQH